MKVWKIHRRQPELAILDLFLCLPIGAPPQCIYGDESAFAVSWAIHHYLRHGDTVILIHVSPTSVLLGADWGPLPQQQQISDGDSTNKEHQQQMEDDFDAFTATKTVDLARPLMEAGFPYKIHIVKDHDMRERLCLEIERLSLSAVIMGSRGCGAEKRGSDGKLE